MTAPETFPSLLKKPLTEGRRPDMLPWNWKPQAQDIAALAA
jgi:hypothetical protein